MISSDITRFRIFSIYLIATNITHTVHCLHMVFSAKLRDIFFNGFLDCPNQSADNHLIARKICNAHIICQGKRLLYFYLSYIFTFFLFICQAYFLFSACLYIIPSTTTLHTTFPKMPHICSFFFYRQLSVFNFACSILCLFSATPYSTTTFPID